MDYTVFWIAVVVATLFAGCCEADYNITCYECDGYTGDHCADNIFSRDNSIQTTCGNGRCYVQVFKNFFGQYTRRGCITAGCGDLTDTVVCCDADLCNFNTSPRRHATVIVSVLLPLTVLLWFMLRDKH